jgi:DNA helicase-2/ATP-dependent DNA helicase PcrA
MLGAGAFFERAEVRDVLAWLRLLVDPARRRRRRAGAVAAADRAARGRHRALRADRAPAQARHGRGLAAALESPQLAPEARERIASFLQIQRAAAAALDEERADLFVYRLIERSACAATSSSAPRPTSSSGWSTSPSSASSPAPRARVPGATPREFAAYAHGVADSGSARRRP